MKIVGIAHIDDHRHAGVSKRQRLTLRVAHHLPLAVGGALPGSNLNIEERKVSLAPRPPPVADHGLKEARINVSSVLSAIALSLVPDDAANWIRRKRSDHGVVQ